MTLEPSAETRTLRAESLVAGSLVSGAGIRATPQSRELAASLTGLRSFTGTADASQPLKAAQVFIRNVDPRVLSTVYTPVGQFRAVALLPGTYKVNVHARGLASDVH